MNSSHPPLLGMARVMVGAVLSPPTVSLLSQRELRKMDAVATVSTPKPNFKICRLCGSHCQTGGEDVVIIASLREMMRQVGLDLEQDLSLCPYCLSHLRNLVSLKREIDRLGERLVTMMLGLYTLFTMDLDSPLETLGDEGREVAKFEEDFDVKVDPSYDLLLGLEEAEGFDDDGDQLAEEDVERVPSPSPSSPLTCSLQTRHRRYQTAFLQQGTEAVRNDEGPGCNNDKGSSNAESITCVKNQQKIKRRRGRPRKQEMGKTTEEWSGKGSNCSTCGKTLNSRQSFCYHLIIHSGKKRHAVSVFSQQKSDKTQVPEKKKMGPPYSCYFCDKPLGTSSELLAHLRLHTRERSFPNGHLNGKRQLTHLSCHVCSRRFLQARNLRAHLKTHVPKAEKQTPVGGAYVEGLYSQASPASHTCCFCHKRIARPSDVQAHLSGHTRERQLPPNHPQTVAVKSTPEGFLCPTCGKTIKVRRNFKIHLQAHTGERPHVCTVCGRGFSLARYLDLHMGRHVPEHERQFLCDLCPTRCVNRARLLSHKKFVHTSQRFPCSICNKVLSTAENLKFHSSTHTREKPHVCNICSRRFARPSDLGSHMRKRHVPHTGERPMHSCSHCPKRYSEMRVLRNHIRQAHTPGVVQQRFDCSTCGKSFRRKFYLVTHERIHTGERPFICAICSKGFCARSQLQIHSTVHAKERPYACTKCPRRFAYKTNLSRHVNTVCNSKWGAGDTRPGKLPCYFCGKAESCIWSLMRHIRIHTLERPFGHEYDGRYKAA